MGSKYQPAKFCLQSVRVEFLRLAREINMFPAVSPATAATATAAATAATLYTCV